MNIEAWLVVGEREHREVTINHGTAVEHAAQHHGVVKALALVEDIEAMCREAYDRGVLHGQRQRTNP